MLLVFGVCLGVCFVFVCLGNDARSIVQKKITGLEKCHILHCVDKWADLGFILGLPKLSFELIHIFQCFLLGWT